MTTDAERVLTHDAWLTQTCHRILPAHRMQEWYAMRMAAHEQGREPQQFVWDAAYGHQVSVHRPAVLAAAYTLVQEWMHEETVRNPHRLVIDARMKMIHDPLGLLAPGAAGKTYEEGHRERTVRGHPPGRS